MFLFDIGTLQPDGTFKLHDGRRDWKRIRQTAPQKNWLKKQGLISVQSSAISAVGVEDDKLIIRFHNGSLYNYMRAKREFDLILQANSKGKYFNRKIRGKYQYNRIGSLKFPQALQTADTQELELLSDEHIFNTLDTQYLRDLTRNLDNPTIKFSVEVKKDTEYLKILVNTVAVYFLMEEILKQAKMPKERYYEQLGIAI